MGIEGIRLPEPVKAPLENSNSPAAQEKEAANKMHDEVMGKSRVSATNAGSDRNTCKPQAEAAGPKGIADGDGGNDSSRKKQGGDSSSETASKNGKESHGPKVLEFSNPYEKR